MLVIIDMQNHILNPTSKFYVPNATHLVHPITQRLEKARKTNEYVLFTRDIPVEKKGKAEETNDLQLISALTPLEKEQVIKKYYFTIPPEKLVEIKDNFFANKQEEKKIEVTGVETHLCILANVLALQSAFPEAEFTINQRLVASKEQQAVAFDLLKHFNVSIVE
ncbi:isochorismatase family protein [Candidatus Enterococcus courvalinii]|uniref:Cysteine hydrolase n=1 Tax=Candidatus Enterococcus courvalinii TaxID=2815329 RepID=A0ABS3I103_9ENTE|nr:isochorismatase family protein [Enterococcus sp. MSG2901]MBO0482365.1 cysteine hydrolase [Enterococcus sp. MSG2901]